MGHILFRRRVLRVASEGESYGDAWTTLPIKEYRRDRNI